MNESPFLLQVLTLLSGNEHYVNVDTGCYMHTYGYSQLSAYCVENGEIISVQRVLDGYKKVVKKETY
ncbi:hypothetical protein [Sulfurimonas gotlandica]|nr:hypothetical protein [Sulfurimonas gotlandica]